MRDGEATCSGQAMHSYDRGGRRHEHECSIQQAQERGVGWH